MWQDTDKDAPVGEFLGWVALIWVVCMGISMLLDEYSAAFLATGKVTGWYVVYAIVGVFFDTPNPMIATYIVLRRHGKIRGVKDFCRLVLHTARKGRTLLITACFCSAALLAALLFGTPNGSPWYLMPLALPLMVLGGGVEEIGWRGFLQPALEKKLPYPAATLLTAVIWITWHLPLWLLPSSNHFGDSILGFVIMFTVWSFVAAGIYKATKSVAAAVVYHAFMNAIGAVFDWNGLFDAFPNQPGMYVYFFLILTASVVLWKMADRREQRLHITA